MRLTDICKAYGKNVVLDRFNCEIKENSITCLMGPSGQGKTTILRIMMGLERPDSGEITGMLNLRKSAVFQEDRLCENLTAASNIRLVGGQISAEDFGAVELPPDCINQPARLMSGGQRRRVAILRALLAEYDILFMDEPFKGLDAGTKERVMLYVKEKSRGKTVVLVTHDEAEREMMGGDVIRISGKFTEKIRK
jgi:NitT/TauT family transport system ATP-binding protein